VTTDRRRARIRSRSLSSTRRAGTNRPNTMPRAGVPGRADLAHANAASGGIFDSEMCAQRMLGRARDAGRRANAVLTARSRRGPRACGIVRWLLEDLP